MVDNPLIAQPVSQTRGFSGIPIAEDAVSAAEGLASGSWVEGGLGAVATGADIADTLANPFGALFAAGAGWLMEHFEPLRQALDWLAGKPEVIASYGQTWDNVAKALAAIKTGHEDAVRADLTGWQGTGADSYRERCAEVSDALTSAASVSGGLSTATTIMGSLVDMVRSTVRDLIARLVGNAVQWLLEEAFTLGLATPVVVGQITTAVANAMAKVSKLLAKVTESIRRVTPLLKKLEDLFAKIADKLRKLRAEGRMHTPEGGQVPGSRTSPSAHAGDPIDSARAPKDRPDCGDPVDPVTGHVFMTMTDVELPGLLDLVIERTHLSSYRSGRLFGPSWASTVDQRLELGPQGIVFLAEDGRALTYPYPSDSPVFPTHGARWPLNRTADGYTVAMPHEGRTLHFGVTGPVWASGSRRALLAITTGAGDRIDFSYTDGELSDIRHSGGYHVTVDTADGRITGLRLEGVQLASYEYSDGDLTGALIAGRSAARFTYDVGRITSWTDGNDEWYWYFYSPSGQCTHTEGKDGALSSRFAYQPGSTVYTNALGYSTTYAYNSLGHVERETDALGNTTESTWDSYGNLLSRTDRLGRVTRFHRDADGTFLGLTRADGAAVVVTRDDDGRVVQVDDVLGTWRHSYDSGGRLVASTTPDGATTRYGYGSNGHITSITDPLGGVTTVEPNAAGLAMTVTDPLGAVTRYSRDQFGRVTSRTDPLGNVTRQGWTVSGNPLWRTLPDGSTEQWRYDAEGNLIGYVDPTGQVTRMTVTSFDRPAGVVTPDGAQTVYAYDAELRLASVTDPQGLVWRYSYDAVGNLLQETDFNGRTVSYSWDAEGQLVSRTNAVGQTVTFAYDVLGNVVSQVADGRETVFAYAVSGDLVSASNPDCSVSLTRDEMGRVVAETVAGRTVVSRFDIAGRRTGRTTPAGVQSTWDYDALDQPVALHTSGQSLRFSYDDAGREVLRRLPGASLSHSWDAAYRLRSQVLGRQVRGWTYRADGHVTSSTDTVLGDRSYTLDSVGRVLRVGSESYTYDLAGNVTSHASYAGTLVRSSGRARFAYDAQGRVISRQVRTLSGGMRTWQFTWDAEDRLVSTVTPDGVQWRYAYDPFGRRISKQRLSVPGEVVEEFTFAWDGTLLAEQAHTTDGVTQVTTWDYHPLDDHPVAQTSALRTAPQDVIDRQFHAIVTDLIGTPTELVDTTGTVVWRHPTTLWGLPLTPPPATGPTCPLRFPGHYADPETGWHYNYFRYYDPTTARYTTPDPLGLEGGPNRHTYVPNPTFWTDPLGLTPCKRHIPRSVWDHIFRGDFKKGRASGYHHRPGGRNRYGWRTRNLTETDAHGVYEATVIRRDGDGNTWVEKTRDSSFFPDDWSESKVRRAVERAFKETDDLDPDTGFWSGRYRGVRIEGWSDPGTGALRTAYPVRERRKNVP